MIHGNGAFDEATFAWSGGENQLAVIDARSSKLVDGIIDAMDFRLTPWEIAEVEGQ